MRLAIATCAALPDGYPDDAPLVEALRVRGAEVRHEVWTDPDAVWDGYDLVLIRSVWDYTQQRDEFVAWAERVGDRLRNPPGLIRWNSDKRYLAELSGAGLPVVPTTVVEPGEEPPGLEGEVVVKPVVSAGASDTGRFGPGAHDRAVELIGRLGAGGRAALVQPYLGGVDEQGETAIVHFGGRPSHVLRKGAVLAPDEVAPMGTAPVGEGELVAAEVMWDPELVGPGEAGPAEYEVAQRVLAEVERRFGSVPVYARVDMVPGPGGEPVLMELEAIEPNFYFWTAPEAPERLAAAILD